MAWEAKEGLEEAQREHIRTIPSMIISEGDRELRRFVGTPAPEELREAIEMDHASEV